MKNILVPVDFSEPSKQAAQYAIAFAQYLKADTVILYHAFQQPLPSDTMLTDPTMNAMELYNISDLGDISREHLNRFAKEVSNGTSTSLHIKTISEFNNIIEGIQQVCASHQVGLVVTGAPNSDTFTETLTGSHAVDIARDVNTPVLIVSGKQFAPIQNILFATDYKQVAATTPAKAIEALVQKTGAQLHVLHVSEHENEENISDEENTLKRLLQNITPQYHTLNSTNFADAIPSFVAEYKIDLVVAVAKKHSFFEGLFRKSHIKTMAYHTTVPLMIMHDNKSNQ